MGRVTRRITRLGVLSSLVLGLALVFSAGEALAQGCAMCRTSVGGAEDPLARGFYTSILFLMSAPYTVIATVGGWLAYRYWKTSRGE